MELLFQSDDFGISRAVTLGIMHGIENGVIRNTGLFTNMDSSEFAASQIKNYPHCCFGVDLNLVAGRPVSDPTLVPSLVDTDGKFISSIKRYEEGTIVTSQGVSTTFETDPYNYDEVCLEMDAQIQRFITLVGKNPEYLHPHSLVTPVTHKAMLAMSEKYNIPLSLSFYEDHGFVSVPADWNIKPVFTIEAQKNTDVETNILGSLPTVLDAQRAVLICHAGYIDADIMDVSSYSVIRVKDLRMATSDKIKQFIENHNIKLVTYRDLVK